MDEAAEHELIRQQEDTDHHASVDAIEAAMRAGEAACELPRLPARNAAERDARAALERNLATGPRKTCSCGEAWAGEPGHDHG